MAFTRRNRVVKVFTNWRLKYFSLALPTQLVKEDVRLFEGVGMSLISVVITTAFMVITSITVLNLPWYFPFQVLGGFSENNPGFILKGFGLMAWGGGLLGLIFTLLLATIRPARIILGGIFFGLSVWALLQFFIWPAFFPLVFQGAPPVWSVLSFLVYGLSLGLLLEKG